MINGKMKNVKFALLLVVIVEIFLLINLSIFHSYIIRETNSVIENKVERDSENLTNSGINFLIGFLSIKEIGFVSAQSVGCCMENCLEIVKEECEGNWASTVCSLTTECKPSTCVDQELGTCSAGAPKKICEEDGGEWKCKNEGGECKPIPINEVDECQFGCCTLDNGASKKYVRRIECISKEGSFDSSVSERECRIYTQSMGACVIGEEDCKFTTEEDCKKNLNGGFHLGSLCSNPDLNTSCKKPNAQNAKTKCYNDKVYFLDSCDNLANVYDSSKFNDDDYWKYVQTSDCSDGKGNVKSTTCGDCDKANSVCSSASGEGVNPNYGDYVCKDLSCIDENGNERKNTEAWCVYESYVGDSKDVVGSEYRVRWCDRGEIKSDLCGNWRGKICGERELEFEKEDAISLARCRSNEGFKCFQLGIVPYEFNDKGTITNQEEVDEYAEECETYSDCRVANVNMRDIEEEGIISYYSFGRNKDEFLLFKACVPKYPVGLEFWNPESNAEKMCDMASVEIPVIERKQLTGWVCSVNCNVLEYDFIEQMNEYCMSLGDCGAYVNVEGKYTKNFKVREGDSGDLDSDKKKEYKNNANKIGKGDLPSYFSSTEIGSWAGDPLEQIQSEEAEFDYGAYIGLGFLGGVAGGLAGWGVFELGVLAEGATIFGPIGWGIAIGAAIVIGILWLLDIGKTREIIVEFECKPWEAPVGGDYCDMCDDDPLRPCTEYKCRSLGTGCRLIDEDELYESENPICVYKYKNDKIPPYIKFGEIDEEKYNVEENNKGVKISAIEVDDGCIQEFSYINFSLKTENENGEDDFAKCVYNLERTQLSSDYGIEGEEFKEKGFFSVNHSFDKRLPFVANLDSADITGNVIGERTGDLNLYVRCIDYAGNPNYNEYVVNLCIKEGPDNDIAIINEYSPKQGSFLKYQNITNVLTISLDEPAECKWSHSANILYNNMKNKFICNYNENHPELGGKCTTTLTGLEESENKIYIKCKDQPWISKIGYDGPWKENDRNINENDFVYILHATENPLQISSISPQGELVRGGNEKKFNLEVTTSGGANKGISTCKYEFVKSPSGINSGDIFAQKDTIHTYSFNWNSGHYNILITCEDDAGNEVQKNAVFDLSVDELPPSIVRIYKEGGSLKLVTNEDAKCYYDSNSCSFTLEEGTSMTTAFSNVHVTDWNPGLTYYIKCKDIFENVNPDCVNKIIPST